ncbi:MAG: hypothetical protein IJ875_03320 [Solobacterium sp.]|nr:hypothetical protein [Solobacterium sp.]
MESLKLKCIECGGTMDVDPSKKVLACPYCGSKQLMVDSDEVKIAEINANRDTKIQEIKTKNEVMIKFLDVIGKMDPYVILIISLFLMGIVVGILSEIFK